MDDFNCSLSLSGDELLFLYQMCSFANDLPRSIRKKLGGDQIDMIRGLASRLEVQLKAYQAFCKELSEV